MHTQLSNDTSVSSEMKSQTSIYACICMCQNVSTLFSQFFPISCPILPRIVIVKMIYTSQYNRLKQTLFIINSYAIYSFYNTYLFVCLCVLRCLSSSVRSLNRRFTNVPAHCAKCQLIRMIFSNFLIKSLAVFVQPHFNKCDFSTRIVGF